VCRADVCAGAALLPSITLFYARQRLNSSQGGNFRFTPKYNFSPFLNIKDVTFPMKLTKNQREVASILSDKEEQQ
jgi:hypothetical protein